MAKETRKETAQICAALKETNLSKETGRRTTRPHRAMRVRPSSSPKSRPFASPVQGVASSRFGLQTFAPSAALPVAQGPLGNAQRGGRFAGRPSLLPAAGGHVHHAATHLTLVLASRSLVGQSTTPAPDDSPAAIGCGSLANHTPVLGLPSRWRTRRRGQGRSGRVGLGRLVRHLRRTGLLHARHGVLPWTRQRPARRRRGRVGLLYAQHALLPNVATRA